MTNSNLVLHAGGWSATEEQVNAVEVPVRTTTYTPIAHGRVVDHLRGLLPQHGLKLDRLQLALSANGQRLFGVADVVNGTGRPDWGLAIGFRNSYDKAFALNLCAGSRVFVCDNLAFSGEVQLRRKHQGSLDVELPNLINDLIYGVAAFKQQITLQTDTFKATNIGDLVAHDVICRALRAGVIPASSTAVVLNQWDEAKHEEFAPRNAWSLFNAFTEAAKLRSPELQFRSTLSLNRLFNSVFVPAAQLPDSIEAS